MHRVVLNAPYSQVLGRKPTGAEAIADLCRFDLRTSLRELAHLLYVIFYEPQANGPAQQGAISHWLSEGTRAGLARYRDSARLPVKVFLRHQVLLAMKLLCLAHAGTGGLCPSDDKQARHLLGDTLLKVTDLLETGAKQHVSRDLICDPSDLLHAFNLSVMVENEPPGASALARHDLILNHFVPSSLARKGDGATDWSEPFRNQHDAELHDVALVARVLFLMFQTRRCSAQDSVQHPWFDRTSFFSNCRIDQERVDAALRHLSADWDALPHRAWRESRGPLPMDVAMFLDKPLICDPPGYQVVDVTALLGMSGDRLLRQVRGAIPISKQQDSFGCVLGNAFEEYVGWLLKSVYGGDGLVAGRLTTQPSVAGRRLDFAISYPDAEVAIEVKGILAPDHAIYSGDAKAFGTELYLRYSHKAGVDQIAEYLKRMRARQAGDTPSRVIPVLVVLDRVLSGFGVTSTLRDRLDQKLRNCGSVLPVVSPLVVLTIEDLECALARAECGELLVDILDKVTSNDDGGLQPACELIRPGAGVAHDSPACLRQALAETIRRDGEELFGGPSAAGSAMGSR